VEIFKNRFNIKLKISDINLKHLGLFIKKYLKKILKKYRIFFKKALFRKNI